jgi:hypothetical protein
MKLKINSLLQFISWHHLKNLPITQAPPPIRQLINRCKGLLIKLKNCFKQDLKDKVKYIDCKIKEHYHKNKSMWKDR